MQLRLFRALSGQLLMGSDQIIASDQTDWLNHWAAVSVVRTPEAQAAVILNRHPDIQR